MYHDDYERRREEVRIPTKEEVLKVLVDADGSLVPARVFREALGPKWQDGMNALRAAGYQIDVVLGNGGVRSFRLNPDQPFSPEYLRTDTSIAKAVIPTFTVAHQIPTVRVPLVLEDIRAMLRLDLPPRARDVLVGALMAAEAPEDNGSPPPPKRSKPRY